MLEKVAGLHFHFHNQLFRKYLSLAKITLVSYLWAKLVPEGNLLWVTEAYHLRAKIFDTQVSACLPVTQSPSRGICGLATVVLSKTSSRSSRDYCGSSSNSLVGVGSV